MSTSVDVEMVRPALGDEGVYGVEGAGLPGKWQWRVGTALQYERWPVLIETEGAVSSHPVSDRVDGWVGASLGLGRGFAVQAFVPAAWQQGDDPLLSADGTGAGDPRIGARWSALHGKLGGATLRVDGYIPVGRRDAWLGETNPRAAFGVSGMLDGGFGAVVVDAGLLARPLDEPRPGLDWGTTAEFSAGLRADIGERVTAGAAWVARAVLAGLDERDGELASEVVASGTFAVDPTLRLGAGGGYGVQGGVGAPTWRGFANATWAFDTKKKPKPKPVVAEEPPPPPDPQKILVEEIPGVTDVPPPAPPPPAQVVGDEIEIRDEIRFAQGSADLLPESHATIVAIADLLASDGRIAHLAIEGHASEEGDLAFNWDLSDRRARAVWEALILEGVDPHRMSWRGLGEVAPEHGANKSANRAVSLKIARRLAQGEALPATPADTLLPWNGQATALDAVSIPVESPKPKTDTVDPNAFKEQEEDE